MTQELSIRQTLFSDRGRGVLAALPAAEHFAGRMAMARHVCQHFDFVDHSGGLRLSSCMAALQELETTGAIRLPPAGRTTGITRRPRMTAAPVPAPVAVPERADLVHNLHLEPVTDRARARLLARLMHDEHPQGAVQHAGRQLRYLIGSDHGWLGGFVFASPALRLRARERWLGWTEAERKASLSRVVGMSRFLIRKDVACGNLASRALGLCRRRLATDFEARYKVRPLLVETFCAAGHDGTSLRAAGWVYVGDSTGRGRHAKSGQRVGRKMIFMRPLSTTWRRELGLCGRGSEPPPWRSLTLSPGEGLDMSVWAANEFGEAPLHGAVVKRLVKSVHIWSMAPAKTFFSAACGDGAAVSGYYRMIEYPDESALTPEAMLATHRERTRRRMRGSGTVLCIQDGTDINLATHGGCRGLGIISRNKSSAGTLGIHMQTTLAVNDEGIPLGIPRIEFDCGSVGGDRDRPPEERKTGRWLRGYRDTCELASDLKKVRVIAVMDREGDSAAVFAEHGRRGGSALLVRARHDRVLGDGRKLFGTVGAVPSCGEIEVCVDRASKRRSARGQKAFAGREARRAVVELRWCEVAIPVPVRERRHLGREPFVLTALQARERQVPAGVAGIEWLLLTSLPVGCVADARRVLGYYGLRWRIEDYHRILKTGCQVEQIAHSTAARMKRALTINAVMAWRLSALTLMGRDTPELPACDMLSEAEIAVLLDYARERRLAEHELGLSEISLGRALMLVARMGGYLNRRNDGPPGHQVVWEGYTRLATGSQVMRRMAEYGAESAFNKLNVLPTIG